MVILIADDEPKIRRGLAAHLEALRDPRISRIDTASNGIETMEKIKALHPDIVLLDLCMPQISGIQLIEAATTSSRPASSSAVITLCPDRPRHPT